MYDFELIKNNYVKVRSALLNFLEKFDEKSYYYQPTKKSNAVAWIVPHLAAFEKVMVTDQIAGYKFKSFISDVNVEKYKPGVDAFDYQKEDLMKKEDAIKLLLNAQEASIDLIDKIINKKEETKNLDHEYIFNRYMLNFSHETEHYGQIKYLLGTYTRLQK